MNGTKVLFARLRSLDFIGYSTRKQKRSIQVGDMTYRFSVVDDDIEEENSNNGKKMA